MGFCKSMFFTLCQNVNSKFPKIVFSFSVNPCQEFENKNFDKDVNQYSLNIDKIFRSLFGLHIPETQAL